MEMKVCSTHQNEEEKYICSHNSCLKPEGNNLVCLECFLKHKKGRSNFHKKISIISIKEQAKENLEQFLKLQESTIEKCETFSQQCQQNLADLQKLITNWIEEQSRMIKNSKEQQITILKKNIASANEHYQINKLDHLLYFFKLNLQNEQDISEEFQNQTERLLNYQLKELNLKGQTLISKACNMQNIFQAKKIDLKIQVDTLNDLKYEKCQFHQSKKNYVFTHQNSIDKSNAQLDCLGCLSKSHDIECEKKVCIKKITLIQQEQSQKQKKMNDESKLLQKKIQTSIDKQLEIVSASQKQSNEFYESQKEQYIQLERDSINKLKQSPQAEYILGNIDFSLLFQTDELIELQFLQDYEGLMKKIKVIEEKKPQLQKQFLDIDQETAKIKEQSLLMKQNIDHLTQKLNQQEAKLKDQSIGIVCEGISSIKKMLQKS